MPYHCLTKYAFMEQIPTVEDLFKEYSNLYHFEEGPSEYLIDKEDFSKALIEFTKAHVQAFKEVAKSFKVDGCSCGESEIISNHIDNCYPLENIK